MSDLVRHITDAEFEEKVLKADRPVLVDFWAPWCGPCRTLAPAIESLASRYDGKASVVKINVDDNPEHASRLGIQGIPTIMVFEGGNAVERIVGLVPEEVLARALDKHVTSPVS